MSVIEWLESSEGEAWSFRRHVESIDGTRIHILMSLKGDMDDGFPTLIWVA